MKAHHPLGTRRTVAAYVDVEDRRRPAQHFLQPQRLRRPTGPQQAGGAALSAVWRASRSKVVTARLAVSMLFSSTSA